MVKCDTQDAAIYFFFIKVKMCVKKALKLSAVVLQRWPCSAGLRKHIC